MKNTFILLLVSVSSWAQISIYTPSGKAIWAPDVAPTDGQFLKYDLSSAKNVWSTVSGGSFTAPTGSGFMRTTSGSMDAASAELSGAVTTSGSGVTTLANNAVTTVKITDANVTLPKLAAQADGTVVGNSSGGAASPTAIGTLPTAVQGNITAVGTLASGAVPGSLLTGTILSGVQDNITRVGTLAAGAVPTSLLTGTIGASQLASDSVTTVKILDANVTLPKMASIATDSILGRATSATGVPEVLTALPFAFTGDVTRAIDSNAQTIANDAVTTVKVLDANITLAKMANIATASVIGRNTGSTGVPEVLTTLPNGIQDNITRLGTVTTGSLDAARIASGTLDGARLPDSARARGIGANFYAGGEALSAGMKLVVPIEWAFTITAAKVIADRSGSAAVAVQVQTYTAYDGAWSGSSIVASAPPTLTTAIKSKDTTLTGWTTLVPADSYALFTISSVSGGITNLNVFLPGQ